MLLRNELSHSSGGSGSCIIGSSTYPGDYLFPGLLVCGGIGDEHGDGKLSSVREGDQCYVIGRVGYAVIYVRRTGFMSHVSTVWKVSLQAFCSS